MSEDDDNRASEVCIVQLTTNNKERWHRMMAAAVLATGDRLYALFDGLQPAVYTCPIRIKVTISRDYVSWSHSDSPLAGTAAGPGLFPTATEDLLQETGRIMQPVAYYKPQLNVIPLLSFASWSTDKVAKLDVQTLLYDPQDFDEANALSRQLNHVREISHLPPLALTPLATTFPAHEPPEQEQAAADDRPLTFSHVAVGGTFDRLHVGHRLLLAATALICTEKVYIGVTGDQLLQKKAHKELLESYDSRAHAAENYVKAMRPALSVQTGALLDPKAPTVAATDENMQALVVSKETIPGAEDINRFRRNAGYVELHIIVVDLIADTQAVQGGKVSSTALREQEAARQRGHIAV